MLSALWLHRGETRGRLFSFFEWLILWWFSGSPSAGTIISFQQHRPPAEPLSMRSVSPAICGFSGWASSFGFIVTHGKWKICRISSFNRSAWSQKSQSGYKKLPIRHHSTFKGWSTYHLSNTRKCVFSLGLSGFQLCRWFAYIYHFCLCRRMFVVFTSIQPLWDVSGSCARYYRASGELD